MNPPSSRPRDRAHAETLAGDRPEVLLTEPLAEAPRAWLEPRCRLQEVAPEHPGFGMLLDRASALVVRTATVVDATLLQQTRRLRVIGRAGVGLDTIDVAACRARGVEVVYTPNASTQAVVEFVMSLLCDRLRPRPPVTGAVGALRWRELRDLAVGERQLDEVTLGILGLGRIGKRLAAVARGVGCRVVYNDLVSVPPAQRLGAEPVACTDLFSQCDVVSVHIDGRPSNRHFVGPGVRGPRSTCTRRSPSTSVIRCSVGPTRRSTRIWLGAPGRRC
jgi:phosphoglycerate dehydrogenase-like enzyme